MERNQRCYQTSPATGEVYQLQLVDEGHAQRQKVEQFIASRFNAVHGAQITVFMPLFLALFDADNQVRAAVGVRMAGEDKLFLEHYFDLPIEAVILDRHHPGNRSVVRTEVVEVGNLASVDRYASRRLFEQLAVFLISNRFQWVVFTSCRSLRAQFQRMKLKLVELGSAAESSLPESFGSWGSYYRGNPQVMLGHLSGGIGLARRAAELMPQGGV